MLFLINDNFLLADAGRFNAVIARNSAEGARNSVEGVGNSAESSRNSAETARNSIEMKAYASVNQRIMPIQASNSNIITDKLKLIMDWDYPFRVQILKSPESTPPHKPKFLPLCPQTQVSR